MYEYLDQSCWVGVFVSPAYPSFSIISPQWGGWNLHWGKGMNDLPIPAQVWIVTLVTLCTTWASRQLRENIQIYFCIQNKTLFYIIPFVSGPDVPDLFISTEYLTELQKIDL